MPESPILPGYTKLFRNKKIGSATHTPSNLLNGNVAFVAFQNLISKVQATQRVGIVAFVEDHRLWQTILTLPAERF